MGRIRSFSGWKFGFVICYPLSKREIGTGIRLSLVSGLADGCACSNFHKFEAKDAMVGPLTEAKLDRLMWEGWVVSQKLFYRFLLLRERNHKERVGKIRVSFTLAFRLALAVPSIWISSFQINSFRLLELTILAFAIFAYSENLGLHLFGWILKNDSSFFVLKVGKTGEKNHPQKTTHSRSLRWDFLGLKLFLTRNWQSDRGELMVWDSNLGIPPKNPNPSWWQLKYFGIFIPFWGRFPIWLIFFKWIETTN